MYYGVYGKYSQSRYPQREFRKTGNYSETKGDGKLKTVRIEKGWGSNTQSVTKFGL